MPRDLQTSLLRAIETHTVVRVGGQQVTPVDVRIITATHKDLIEEVRGNFRSDLFFRLNVFPIEAPPLRERRGDVAVLLRHILQRQSTRLNRVLGIDARGAGGARRLRLARKRTRAGETLSSARSISPSAA